ncbi:carbohydrate ABC transporter permease [Cohnella lupini]|uniref:Multiple sugar transport system permease protein n=1 Tax=Cohnella lupini TaxID=1294267 RepID=A0A3D9I9Z0_9BACL|nr:sugar ABC transporter permease [Cohnella lupini]RED58531.1 multiple sugar transport system permease protein [Cohnella lupini]
MHKERTTTYAFKMIRRHGRPRHKEALIGFAYALPALLLLLLFRFWPLGFGVWISFWKWGYVPEKFIGFDNYIRIFTEDLVYRDPSLGLQLGAVGQSVLVTLYYAIGTIPITIVLAFLISYYLFQNRKGKGLLRTVFFLPFITSQVAAAIVFKWIFHPNVGVANSMLEKLRLPIQNWFVDPDPIGMKLLASLGGHWPDWLPIQFGGPTLALAVIIIFAIWSSLGFNIVILLAGLSNVPSELYEAARMDGARTPTLIRHVTLPMLSPMLFLLLIISVIGAFESFNAFYVFSGGEGGPLGTTMSLPLYIFRSFYVYGQVGYASALSICLFAVVLALTWIQYRFGEKRVHYQH